MIPFHPLFYSPIQRDAIIGGVQVNVLVFDGSKKSAYSATKFAIQDYSEALFKELRGFDIKVDTGIGNPGQCADR